MVLEANNLAIQVHGGDGYTREYDVEQHSATTGSTRSTRAPTIPEPDLFGRKVTQGGGASLAALGDTIDRDDRRQSATPNRRPRRAARLDWQRLVARHRRACGGRRPRAAPANSVIYLEAFEHTVVAWMWLEQLLAATGGTVTSTTASATARYFFRYELPKVAPQLDLLESVDRTTLDMRDEWF